MHIQPFDAALFDGYAQIQPQLEQQFIEHIGLAASFEQVILMVKQYGVQVIRSRIQARMLEVSSLKTRKPVSPTNSGLSADLGSGTT